MGVSCSPRGDNSSIEAWRQLHAVLSFYVCLSGKACGPERAVPGAERLACSLVSGTLNFSLSVKLL